MTEYDKLVLAFARAMDMNEHDDGACAALSYAAGNVAEALGYNRSVFEDEIWMESN